MKKYYGFFVFLLPALIALSSLYFLGIGDGQAFIRWYLSLFVSGVVFLPLTSYLFCNSPDLGYSFAKPLAMCIMPLSMWTLSYFGFPASGLIPSLLILFVFAGLSIFLPDTGKYLTKAFKNPVKVSGFALYESMFALSLLFWSFARGLKPLADTLEKPMNYGFMMSILRTESLPAPDMWYAGGSINYYYFGHYIYSFFTGLSGLDAEVTYNLSLATTFALTVTLSFSVCYMLIYHAKEIGAKLYRGAPVLGGTLGAFIVAFAGNSHSFFFGTRASGDISGNIYAPGHRILLFLSDRGLLDKWSNTKDAIGENADEIRVRIENFWFANSTRFIGYNPPTNDRTIHEFPYYSFLVADLHAHLINLSMVLLITGIFIAAVRSGKWTDHASVLRLDYSGKEENWLKKDLGIIFSFFKKTVSDYSFILISVLMGIFMMSNFWDFAIYTVVFAMVLFIVNLRATGKIASAETLPVFLFQIILIMVPFMFISSPIAAIAGYAAGTAVCFLCLIFTRDAFTVTGAKISLMFLLSHIITLPFSMNFDPMSKTIALTVARTPLFQLSILWGAHILIGLLFLFFLIKTRASRLVPSGGLALYSKNKFTRFISGMNTFDLLAAGIFVCGIIFIILPEIIYVVDIYSGDFKRANTMFKFTYQAFVMLGISGAYGVSRLISISPFSEKSDFRWSFAGIFMALLLIIPGYYPFVATGQWLGEFSFERYQGLSAIENLPDRDTVKAVRWINENIKGQPVLLESYGDSYTDYNQISAFTGLPTVMGWQTHQWLWRTSSRITDAYNEVVRPRQIDVRTIYEFTDENAAVQLLDKYKVSYIVIGSRERDKFPEINEAALIALGEIVFSSDSIVIVEIN